MKSVDIQQIYTAACGLICEANTKLPEEITEQLRIQRDEESAPLAQEALRLMLENAEKASETKLPLCQDTGAAVFFVEMGHEVQLQEPIEATLRRAVADTYRKSFFRASMAVEPIFDRKNTEDNTPPIVHLEQVPGDNLKITFLPKGGGAENKSRLTMLRPADGKEGVTNVVLDTVQQAGGAACPPFIVGVGVGGTFDTVASLAKKAIMRPILPEGETSTFRLQEAHSYKYTEWEAELTEKINALKVGPMGFGGMKTVLAVHIEHAPCHIASLPVAVNLQCHSARKRSIEL